MLYAKFNWLGQIIYAAFDKTFSVQNGHLQIFAACKTVDIIVRYNDRRERE